MEKYLVDDNRESRAVALGVGGGFPSFSESPSYKLIDGRLVSSEISDELRAEVLGLVASGRRVPHLAAILVGHDGGSETYVSHKVRKCAEIGFRSTLFRFESDVTESELLSCVESLNADDLVDGFIVQLPLPAHISSDRIIESISPSKDVDGFHPLNVGRMQVGLPCFLPATPYGILELLRRYEIETVGKHCVILGRSNIVGKPLSVLLQGRGYPGDCTVTVCHSRTVGIKDLSRSADILISALGVPGFVTADMINPGAVVIDVGTTRVPSPDTKSGYRLMGDVCFAEVAPLCSHITPVPGGVGPMTIISLMRNTLQSYLSRSVQV